MRFTVRDAMIVCMETGADRTKRKRKKHTADGALVFIQGMIQRMGREKYKVRDRENRNE
ncbi:hypothetical protein CXIVA_04660 [Clostridium sp. SY8519]|jgi:hypothetical protein|nr:hypothetical protein CXIVA_04660 [Clostridium sp. SY8519]